MSERSMGVGGERAGERKVGGGVLKGLEGTGRSRGAGGGALLMLVGCHEINRVKVQQTLRIFCSLHYEHFLVRFF